MKTHIISSLDTLTKKYNDGSISLKQYYNGLSDISFFKRNPKATFNGKPIKIK